jgi:hypothetical protein
MSLRAIAVLVAVTGVLAGGCNKKGAGTAEPVALTNGTFKDATGEIQIDVGYAPGTDRDLAVVVRMKAIGLEEMDKIVADVVVDGFVLTQGSPEWSGFVAPRQPITHRVEFRLLDDVESGTLTVSVRRSRDSELLYETALPFVANGTVLAPE